MQRQLFGTDGIRGTANIFPMTAETALALGRATGKLFQRQGHLSRVVIGKDTRLSGYMLEPAMTAGFISAGMDVLLVGPMPTPAISFLTRSLRCDLGIMISASHNPFADNGIKLFGPDGYKLSDEIELEIERLMENLPKDGGAKPSKLGRARRINDASGRYAEAVKSSFPRGASLEGLKIAIDCANGAAYHLAPEMLIELGAHVVDVGTAPDGLNINDQVGSTYPETVAKSVAASGADIGIALDGDADRVILVDEKGKVLDGDQVLAMITRSWHENGQLKGGGVAVTVMSNLGFEKFVRGLGLDIYRTKVGDRYVVETMRQQNLNIGGEQSGHIILSDFATTGDGLLAAIQILSLMMKLNKPLSEISQCFEPVPQRLENIRCIEKPNLEHPAIQGAIQQANDRLGDQGRVLVRPSGTEPLVRVMIESTDEQLLSELMESIKDTITRTI